MEKQRRNVRVYCSNTGHYHDVPIGSTLEEIFPMISPSGLTGTITNAKVNNVVEDLSYTVFSNKDIEFQDITSEAGMRVNARSLFFVMCEAVRDLFGDSCSLEDETAVASGTYCRLTGDREVTADVLALLDKRVREYIDMDLPFIKITTHTEDALKTFEKFGQYDKVQLLKSRKLLYTTYYTLNGYPDYYYGPLLKSTGQIANFSLEQFSQGILLRLPDPKHPNQLLPLVRQDKMLEVIREQKEWQKIIGISTIGELNDWCQDKRKVSNVINVSEALQERKIAMIAQNIQSNSEIRLVLIAGPSSSGKTTFSKRLSIQLIAAGIKPVPISMDDYFVDREQTPLDEKGNYDFESVYALNIPRLQEDLKNLMEGKEVELPKFDFLTGKSVPSGNKLTIDEHTVIVMEGIHGLNPTLTDVIPASKKYKIFVSALTTIQLDHHNYIPTSDNRLLRRIVRDYKYRNYSAEETIRRWPSVLEGESKWIVPWQEEADIMFNSSLVFELAGLRTQALPMLETVPENLPEYSEAMRLRKFLGYIQPINTEGLPPTSLLREFLGGSTFHY